MMRGEPHDGKDGHRRITVFREGELRVELFVFEAGGISRRIARHVETPEEFAMLLTVSLVR